MDDKTKWWQDKETRERMVDALMKKSLLDRGEAAAGILLMDFFDSKGKNFDGDSLKRAFMSYIAILQINFVYDTPALQSRVEECREKGVNIDLRNLQTYGDNVAELAKSLDEMGFKTEAEVKKFLPILFVKVLDYYKIVGQTRMEDSLLKTSTEIQKELAQITMPIVYYDETNVENKVDSALNELE